MKQRTRPGRLRGVDAWLRHERASGWPGDVALLDVGFGVAPLTTVELFDWARGLRPGVSVEGWELDAGLVERAQAFAQAGLSFRRAPTQPEARFDVARAFNVGRGGPADAVPTLHAQLTLALRPGGVALEGSTDLDGHLAAFHVLEPAGVRAALVLATDCGRAVAPWSFRDVLPRDWRRSAAPGTPVYGLLDAWHRAWETVRGEHEARRALADAADRLAASWPITIGRAGEWLWLTWAPPGGVPSPLG